MRPAHRRWTSIVLVLVLGAASATPVSASRPGGTVDTHFGTHGVLHLDLPGNDYPTAMTTTTTGRIAVLIESPEGAWIAMLTQRGRLDRAFGRGGMLHLRLGEHTSALSVEPARGGGLLVAGWVFDSLPGGVAGEGRLVIARYRRDGRLDRRFGRGGYATTQLGDLTPADYGPVQFAVAPDGSLVVAAITGAVVGYFGGAATAVLLKFRSDGSRDHRFGAGGVVPLGNRDVIPAIGGMSIDRAGRILVGEVNQYVLGLAASELTVRRFMPGGLPDAGFGVGGVVHVPVPGEWTSLSTITHDTAGNVLAYGDTAAGTLGVVEQAARSERDRGWSPYAARLTPSGQLDPGFGAGGVSMLHTDGRRQELGWTGDLIAPVGHAPLATAMLERSSSIAFSLIRLGPTGGVDRSFGDRGSVDLPMSNALAITRSGSSVIVAGDRSWQRGGTVLAAYEM